MSKEKIVKIIMRRDQMSRKDAALLVEETIEAMEGAIESGDYEEAETILA